jgi:hypothetical protein
MIDSDQNDLNLHAALKNSGAEKDTMGTSD